MIVSLHHQILPAELYSSIAQLVRSGDVKKRSPKSNKSYVILVGQLSVVFVWVTFYAYFPLILQYAGRAQHEFSSVKDAIQLLLVFLWFQQQPHPRYVDRIVWLTLCAVYEYFHCLEAQKGSSASCQSLFATVVLFRCQQRNFVCGKLGSTFPWIDRARHSDIWSSSCMLFFPIFYFTGQPILTFQAPSRIRNFYFNPFIYSAYCPLPDHWLNKISCVSDTFLPSPSIGNKK